MFHYMYHISSYKHKHLPNASNNIYNSIIAYRNRIVPISTLKKRTKFLHFIYATDKVILLIVCSFSVISFILVASILLFDIFVALRIQLILPVFFYTTFIPFVRIIHDLVFHQHGITRTSFRRMSNIYKNKRSIYALVLPIV